MSEDRVKSRYLELEGIKQDLPFWDAFKRESNEEESIAQWLQTHKLIQIKLIGDKKDSHIITGHMLDLVKKYLLNPIDIGPKLITGLRKNSDSFKKAMVMNGFDVIQDLIEVLGEPKEKVARFLSDDFNLKTFDRYYREAKAK